ncbi:MAG: hypothetical protein ACD_10C00435G0001, partial [uncultured bacterium]
MNSQGAAVFLQLTDQGGDVAHLLFQTQRLSFQRRNLGRVAPAEDVTAAVVKTVAVILFMPFAGRLDLAG